jgi:mRNA interferase MazF
MKPGDILLVNIPTIGAGPAKLRPALLLAQMPGPYQNLLVCGVSTQMKHLEPNWDEVIDVKDSDFGSSGLHQASAIRLSYLYAAERREVLGRIGSISEARLERLRTRLADHIAH